MKKIILALLIVVPAQFSAFAASPMPGGAQYDVAFSPKGQSLDLVQDAVTSAKQSILVAAYSFTSKPISLALVAAHRRGVKVQVVADARGNSSKYTAVTFLANQGVPVRLNSKYAIHHHKFIVIDGMHVQTGSFNYSAAAANKNAENVLVLWNVKPLADEYSREWQRLWREGVELKAKY